MVMLKFNSLLPCDNGSYKLPNADATKFGRTKGRQRCRILASLLVASEHSSSAEIRQNL